MIYRTTTQGEIMPKENLILITVDSFNPRYLQPFGYNVPTTPVLNSIKNDCLLFNRCMAGASFSPIATTNVLCGNYHVTYELDDWLDGIRFQSIAQCLPADYKKAGFSGLGHIGSGLGFNKGFDIFDEPLPSNDPNRKNKYEWVRHMYDTYGAGPKAKGFYMGNWFVDRMVDFIDKNRVGPFMVYAHYAETHIGAERQIPKPYHHFPNNKPQNYMYDGKLRWWDTEFIAPLVDVLKKNGIYENTTIVITGDHGESFGYHNEPTHGLWVYNEGMRVPLIIKSNRVKDKGRVVSNMVRHIDILPTCLDVLGMGYHDLAGQSVLKMFDGQPEHEEPIVGYLENYGTRYSGEQRGLVTNSFKYILTEPALKIPKDPFYEDLIKRYPQPRELLFDLRNDPNEQVNLVGDPAFSVLHSKFANMMDKAKNDKEFRDWRME
jgi:arylsulfatase A-like enzyme